MERGKLYYLIDILMAISFLIVVLTGIVKWPELTQYFTGVYRVISPNIMTWLHDWSGAVMTVLVLIHLILHWKWIVVMTKKIFGRRKNERKKV